MCKHRQNPSIRNFIDESNRHCVLVPLANSLEFALLEAEDYFRLLIQGMSPNWCLSRNGCGQAYVRVAVRRFASISVARMVVGATFKEVVAYRNGNRLDLRRANLEVRKGGRAHKDCETLLSRVAEVSE